MLRSTRRHTRPPYEARDKLLSLAQLADQRATTEVPEFIPSRPALRPSDRYIAAAPPGSRAALDIGICSPDASNAGLDCCESTSQRKNKKYARYFGEMTQQNLRYKPVVMSCYGRLPRKRQ